MANPKTAAPVYHIHGLMVGAGSGTVAATGAAVGVSGFFSSCFFSSFFGAVSARLDALFNNELSEPKIPPLLPDDVPPLMLKNGLVVVVVVPLPAELPPLLLPDEPPPLMLKNGLDVSVVVLVLVGLVPTPIQSSYVRVSSGNIIECVF